MKIRSRIRMVTALVAAVAALWTATPTQAADLDPGLALGNFQLRRLSNWAKLDSRVQLMNQDFTNIGVNSILQQANNQGHMSAGVCNSAAVANGVDPVDLVSSFCFDDDDNGNENSEWYPQGVTSVADADVDKTWGDPTSGWDPAQHRPLLVTWYNKDDWNDDGKNDDVDIDGMQTEVKGVRISFIDPSTGKYAHVLLVYPFTNASGNSTWMSLRTAQKYGHGSLHAGGIVWYGYKLYVADTNRGFRVFDLRNIIDLGGKLPEGTIWDGNLKTAIGRQNGVFFSHGYRYILPESDGWTNLNCDSATDEDECVTQDPAVKCTQDDITPTFSYASLDRSETVRHIVTGEWCERPNTTVTSTGRIIRWPMEDDGGVPRIAADGYWEADAAYRIPYDPAEQNNGGIQGVGVANGQYYLNQSLGSTTNGMVIVAKPPGTSTGLLETQYRQNGAIGIEDVSVWPGGGGDQTMLWTVTEHPGKRMLYGISPG